MNEIEKKYYYGLLNYIKTNPLITSIEYHSRGKYKINFYEESDDTPIIDINTEPEEYFDFQIRLIDDCVNIPEELSDITLSVTRPNKNYEISGYKPDFLIEITSCLNEIMKFAIEIDGYEWHEKTKEQAANDRRKDRIYLKNGYTPIRFLGTEVYHDVSSCARDTIEIVGNKLHSLYVSMLLGITKLPTFKQESK